MTWLERNVHEVLCTSFGRFTTVIHLLKYFYVQDVASSRFWDDERTERCCLCPVPGQGRPPGGFTANVTDWQCLDGPVKNMAQPIRDRGGCEPVQVGDGKQLLLQNRHEMRSGTPMHG